MDGPGVEKGMTTHRAPTKRFTSRRRSRRRPRGMRAQSTRTRPARRDRPWTHRLSEHATTTENARADRIFTLGSASWKRVAPVENSSQVIRSYPRLFFLQDTYMATPMSPRM